MATRYEKRAKADAKFKGYKAQHDAEVKAVKAAKELADQRVKREKAEKARKREMGRQRRAAIRSSIRRGK